MYEINLGTNRALQINCGRLDEISQLRGLHQVDGNVGGPTRLIVRRYGFIRILGGSRVDAKFSRSQAKNV